MEVIDVNTFREFIYNSLVLLEYYKDKLNNINVFPVTDKDTGTNIYNTLKGIWEKVKDLNVNSLGKFLEYISDAALESAQGNSGNILAMFFYGLYEGLKDKEKATLEDLRNAVKLGYEYAREAIQNPKEGTILSAIKALVESFEKEKNNLVNALNEAINKAIYYLEKYKDRVDSLRKYNVVDAGGLGFVIMIESWLRALNANAKLAIDRYLRKNVKRDLRGGFCINILMENVNNFEELKGNLERIGESIVVNKLGNKVKIHIHSSNIDKVKNIVERHGKVVKIMYSEI